MILKLLSALKFEQKIKLLTNVNQHKSRNLQSQSEATFKLMDYAGTQLKCSQALRNQEQLAIWYRVNTLWEEVQKKKYLNIVHKNAMVMFCQHKG